MIGEYIADAIIGDKVDEAFDSVKGRMKASETTVWTAINRETYNSQTTHVIFINKLGQRQRVEWANIATFLQNNYVSNVTIGKDGSPEFVGVTIYSLPEYKLKSDGQYEAKANIGEQAVYQKAASLIASQERLINEDLRNGCLKGYTDKIGSVSDTVKGVSDIVQGAAITALATAGVAAAGGAVAIGKQIYKSANKKSTIQAQEQLYKYLVNVESIVNILLATKSATNNDIRNRKITQYSNAFEDSHNKSNKLHTELRQLGINGCLDNVNRMLMTASSKGQKYDALDTKLEIGVNQYGSINDYMTAIRGKMDYVRNEHAKTEQLINYFINEKNQRMAAQKNEQQRLMIAEQQRLDNLIGMIGSIEETNSLYKNKLIEVKTYVSSNSLMWYNKDLEDTKVDLYSLKSKLMDLKPNIQADKFKLLLRGVEETEDLVSDIEEVIDNNKENIIDNTDDFVRSAYAYIDKAMNKKVSQSDWEDKKSSYLQTIRENISNMKARYTDEFDDTIELLEELQDRLNDSSDIDELFEEDEKTDITNKLESRLKDVIVDLEKMVESLSNNILDFNESKANQLHSRAVDIENDVITYKHNHKILNSELSGINNKVSRMTELSDQLKNGIESAKENLTAERLKYVHSVQDKISNYRNNGVSSDEWSSNKTEMNLKLNEICELVADEKDSKNKELYNQASKTLKDISDFDTNSLKRAVTMYTDKSETERKIVDKVTSAFDEMEQYENETSTASDLENAMRRSFLPVESEFRHATLNDRIKSLKEKYTNKKRELQALIDSKKRNETQKKKDLKMRLDKASNETKQMLSKLRSTTLTYDNLDEYLDMEVDTSEWDEVINEEEDPTINTYADTAKREEIRRNREQILDRVATLSTNANTYKMVYTDALNKMEYIENEFSRIKTLDQLTSFENTSLIEIRDIINSSEYKLVNYSDKSKISTHLNTIKDKTSILKRELKSRK
jgi:hypothetical protein